MRGLTHSWWIAWRITRLNLRARLEYRGEFLLMIAVGAVWQASVLVFATVLLHRFPGMGGWTSGEVLLMASMRLLSHAAYLLLFGPIVWVTGDGLDAYLLRPMSIHRQIQLAVLNANVFGDLAVAASLFIGALWIVDLTWTPARVGYLLFALVGGLLMEAAITTLLSAAAMHSPSALYWSRWVNDLMTTFGNYPLHILPFLARDLLTFMLPLAFIAYLPAAALTGRQETLAVPAWLAVASPLAGVVAFLAARRVWAFSLRHYKGFGGT